MLDKLSSQILIRVLQKLDVRTLCILSCTSMRLCQIIISEHLWYGKAMEMAVMDGQIHMKWKGSWRNTVLDIGNNEYLINRSSVDPEVFQDLKLYKRWYRCHMDLKNFVPTTQTTTSTSVDRISAGEAEMVFGVAYGRKRLPVIIYGIDQFKSSNFRYYYLIIVKLMFSGSVVI